MHFGHVDFYLRCFIYASILITILVLIKPRHFDNYVVLEANINSEILTPVEDDRYDDQPSVTMVQLSNETEGMELLKSAIRVLCICQTTGPRHQQRAIHIKATWGRRCSKLIFASDEDDPTLPAYKFSNWAGREFVTFKMRGALLWAHTHALANFDWFLKADDDSFIIYENLLLFLSNFNPGEDHYFGRHFAVAGSVIGESFVSGAAYVMSRSALKRYVEEAVPNSKICPAPTSEAHEDVNLGYCLSNIDIYPGESRDKQGRHRFLVFSPWVHLLTGSADKNNWIRKYDKYEYQEGDNCCSDSAILLHYVPGGYMLAMEYLLYRLRPIGFSHHLSEENSITNNLEQNLIKNGYLSGAITNLNSKNSSSVY